MSGFKIIGIRTRDRISNEKKEGKTDFLKKLKENCFFPFYSDFSYDLEKEKLRINSTKELNIYSYDFSDSEGNKKTKHINISAIVGQNGSGKSSIFELLFLAIYNISARCGILKDPDDLVNLGLVSDVNLDFFYQIENNYFCIKLNGLSITLSKGLKTEGEISFNFFEDLKKEDLENFFYSIAINYSLYGLNNLHIGEWIRALFHKNDGYQTPLVINPMRIEGNIDVNTEEYLSKSRLLSNLLIKSKTDKNLKLTDYQNVTDLRFELNKGKIKNLYEYRVRGKRDNLVEWTYPDFYEAYSKNSQIGEIEMLEDIYNVYIQKKSFEINTIHKKEIEKYIVKKLLKIARVYEKYNQYIKDVQVKNTVLKCFNNHRKSIKQNKTFKDFLTDLLKDKSHITFKLNQAVNYLINDPLQVEDGLIWADNKRFQISVKKLAERINISDKRKIIDNLPPSLFNLDIFLEYTSDESKRSSFSSLSSGEQQLIQSVQSIIYHLININSVFENDNKKDEKYKYVNLFLDEVELYFHPEYQRLFVSKLLDSIKESEISNIDGVNIIFSTHSPFILSDILSSNILRLENGEPSEKEMGLTFGANIHDLLAHDFFLEDGFMGEFAKEKITTLIKYLTSNKIKTKEWDFEKSENFINLIGEPFLKNDLKSLLADKLNVKDNYSTKKEIEKEIQRLTQLKSSFK